MAVDPAAFADLQVRLNASEDWYNDFGNNAPNYTFPVTVAGLEARVQSIESTANVVVTQALVPELRAVSKGLNTTRSAIDQQLIPEMEAVVGRVEALEQ